MLLSSLNPKLVSARITILAISFILLTVAILFSIPLIIKTLLYLLFFSISIFLTDFIVIDFKQEGFVSASVAIIMSAVFLTPEKMPIATIILAVAIGILASALLPNKNFLNLSIRAAKTILAVAMAAFVIWLWLSFVGSGEEFWSKLIMAMIATSVFFLTEVALDSVLFSIEKGTSFIIAFTSRVRLLAFVYFSFATVALLMTMMFKWMSLWSILIFSLPLAVIGQSFKLYSYIRQTYKSTIKALSATIEAQDSTREGHAQRVSDLSVAIGTELGFYGNNLERLSYAAMLHDIGKLGFDAAVKPENITEERLASNTKEIPLHAQVGSEIISHVDYLKDVAAIIKYHHITFSSKKLDIPFEARIIHLANAFDHLTSGSGLGKTEALNKLKEAKGLIYDPKVLRALTVVIKRQREKVGS